MMLLRIEQLIEKLKAVVDQGQHLANKAKLASFDVTFSLIMQHLDTSLTGNEISTLGLRIAVNAILL